MLVQGFRAGAFGVDRVLRIGCSASWALRGEALLAS